MKDLAFLESLNQKLIAELDASVALEKELRERIARLEEEVRTERRASAGLASSIRERNEWIEIMRKD